MIAGVKGVVVLMWHANKAGESRIVERCTQPPTGQHCVDMIITNLCVFDVDRKKGGLTLKELTPGVSVEEVRRRVPLRRRGVGGAA
jgi:3-oxoacid CoA-transferase subunit B